MTDEPVAMGTLSWTSDGRRLLYLVPESGGPPARWTIRSIDAAGGRPSTVLVHGVSFFDLGPDAPALGSSWSLKPRHERGIRWA